MYSLMYKNLRYIKKFRESQDWRDMYTQYALGKLIFNSRDGGDGDDVHHSQMGDILALVEDSRVVDILVLVGGSSQVVDIHHSILPWEGDHKRRTHRDQVHPMGLHHQSYTVQHIQAAAAHIPTRFHRRSVGQLAHVLAFLPISSLCCGRSSRVLWFRRVYQLPQPLFPQEVPRKIIIFIAPRFFFWNRNTAHLHKGMRRLFSSGTQVGFVSPHRGKTCSTSNSFQIKIGLSGFQNLTEKMVTDLRVQNWLGDEAVFLRRDRCSDNGYEPHRD